MYLSQHSNTLSYEGEKPVRVVIAVRKVTYRNEDGVISHGTEIVKEITIHANELPKFAAFKEWNRGLFEEKQ